ncbi:MAG: BBP7 family outer membrane beta-barrel protein [Thermoguttaceae bacterium]
MLKTILLCAAALLSASRSLADDPAAAPSPGPAAPSAAAAAPSANTAAPSPSASAPAPSPPAPLPQYFPTPGSSVSTLSGTVGGPVEHTSIDPACAAEAPVTFDVTVEDLLWRLDNTRDQAMILNPALGTTISTRDLNLGWGTGPRITAAYLSDQGIQGVQGIEAGYFGIYTWTNSLVDVAPAGTFLRLPGELGDPGVTADFSKANEMATQDNVLLNSVEMNLLLGEQKSTFSWLLGGRFIRFHEQLDLDSFNFGPPLRISSYQVTANNDLYGVQAGGRWNRRCDRWTLTTVLKLGIFDNTAKQSTLLTDYNSILVLRNFAPEQTAASPMLDGGITLGYQFNDYWSARVGYNAFWLYNVARAPDQLDFTNNAISGSQVSFRDQVLAYGFNFGVEARW